MNDAIKAIQTRYKGYKFRSRLEARWAVFLDACEIEWVYESEGYDLSQYGPTLNCQHGIDIGRYLPDFFLPKMYTWLEIKPDLPDHHFGCTLEEDKLCALARHTGLDAMMFFGMPSDDTPVSVADLDPGIFDCPDWARTRRYSDSYIWQLADPHICIAGFDAAKSARFEFGESGAQ